MKFQKCSGQLVLFFLFGFQFQLVSGSEAVEKPEVIHLSNIVQNKSMIGLDLDTSDLRLASEKEVEKYLGYRNHLLNSEEFQEERSRCSVAGGVEESPFCPLILNSKFGKRNEIDPSIRIEKKKKAKALVRSVERGNLTEVLRLARKATESELSQAFRFVSQSQTVVKFADKLLKLDDCTANPLLVAIGLRLESEFPAKKFKDLAEGLYRKAYSCGNDQSAVAAGYRLGLFQIWSKRCDRAEEVFANIPESLYVTNPLEKRVGPSRSIDYQLRINYWRGVCASQMKNASLHDTMMTKVSQNYPLSLHALILATDLEGRQASLAKIFDPEIRVRSVQCASATQGCSQILRVVRDAEVLLIRGEKETAAIVLKAAIPKVLRLELSFQFYWAVLLQRAGDLASSFNLVGNIFRQDPGLISKSTLQLMYPMEYFDEIRKSNPSGDPFLILSLVRQESAFDINAQSSAGAQGLMQLEWPTARQFERVSPRQLWDPEINLRVGVKYLKKLETRFDGRLDYALASYNAGPERIKGWARQYPTSDPLLFLDLLPLQETRDYVTSIARNYYWYRQLYTQPMSDPVSTVDGEKLLLQLGLRPKATQRSE